MLRRRCFMANQAFEQIGAWQPLHLGSFLTDPDRFRLRQHHPDEVVGVKTMLAQNREGVMVTRLDNALELRVQTRAAVTVSGCLLHFDRVHFV